MLLIALLVLSAVTAFALPSSSQATPQRHFGFWVSGNVIGPPKYTPTQFADAMFLTPPYPSSAEFMMFGATKDIGEGYTDPATAPDVSHDISNLLGIASVTDSYPSIELNVMVALGNLGNPLAQTYFDYYVKELASHPSIYSIGLEGEYSSNVTVANETPLMQAVQNAGKQYIDYYKTSGIGNIISHTNWPMYNNWAYATGPNVIGFSAGYDSNFPFPGSCQLPSDPSEINNNYCGWTQAEEQFIIEQAVGTNYQFIHFTAGADANGSFIDSLGYTTNQMWDNPTLRNWIWADPNYQGNFALSISNVTYSTSTTSVTTTSFTSSSSTTGSSTSVQTTTSVTTKTATTTTSQASSQPSTNTSAATSESTSSYPASQGALSVAYLALPVGIVLVGAGIIVLGPRYRRRTTQKSGSAAG